MLCIQMLKWQNLAYAKPKDWISFISHLGGRGIFFTSIWILFLVSI